MARNRRHFETFGTHTQLKHAVLDAYTKQWASKLAQFTRAERPLWFVDAFAGAGRDKAGRPGSPLIAGAVARDLPRTATAVPDGRRATLNVVAFEKSKIRFRKLEAAVREEFGAVPDFMHLRRDSLGARADRLFSHIAQAPCLTFLDPFGLDGINVGLLPLFMQGRHNEVLALVSDEGALRLYGLIRAQKPDFSAERENVRKNVSLFGESETADLIAAMEEKIQQRERGYEGRDRAAVILTQALGPSWSEEFQGVRTWSEISRRAVQLFCRELEGAGAKYTTTYSVEDSRGRHQYYLVHGTKSPAGVQTMKLAIQSAERRLGIDRSGLLWLADVESAVQQACHALAGQTVRWTVEKGVKAPTVKAYLLISTPLLPGDPLEAAKRLLCDSGLVAQKRPLAFRFPSSRV